MEIVYGNLLDIQSGIVVHGCNCKGVMGSGLAKAVAAKYPAVFAVYRSKFEQSGLHLGEVQLCGQQGEEPFRRHIDAFVEGLPSDLVVANAMTQYNFGTHVRQVDYEAVFAAFSRIRLLARDMDAIVWVPEIGCGLGGGEWPEVAKAIKAALGRDVQCRLVLMR